MANKSKFTNSKGSWPLPPYAVFRCRPAAPFHNPAEFYYDPEESTGNRSYRLVTGDEQTNLGTADAPLPISEMQEVKVSMNRTTGRVKENLVKRSGSILSNQFPSGFLSRNEREIR